LQTTKNDWNKSTDRDRDFERTYPKRYYDYAVRRVVNEVNYHKQVLKGQQFSLAATKLKIKSVAAKTGMAYTKRFS